MGNQPSIENFDSGSLAIWDNRYGDITLNAAGAVTYPAGQVIAFDAVAGKYKATVSGTAVVANAKVVLAEEAVFAGAGDKLVRAIIKGGVDAAKLVFDGTDTLDTIPAGAEDDFRLYLRRYGIYAEDLAVQRIQDNQ